MNILSIGVLSVFTLSSAVVFANDKVEYIEVKVAQQACKNKQPNDAVSMNYRGIVWNGHCQAQFYPSAKTAVPQGHEAELHQFCSKSLGTTSVKVQGVLYEGLCTLGFVAPKPN